MEYLVYSGKELDCRKLEDMGFYFIRKLELECLNYHVGVFGYAGLEDIEVQAAKLEEKVEKMPIFSASR